MPVGNGVSSAGLPPTHAVAWSPAGRPAAPLDPAGGLAGAERGQGRRARLRPRAGFRPAYSFLLSIFHDEQGEQVMHIRRLITIVALSSRRPQRRRLRRPQRRRLPRRPPLSGRLRHHRDPVWLQAESGGGCATFASDQRLAPIISEPCTSTNWWYFRDLSQPIAGAYGDGDELEFVDQSKTFALGFSGGLFKLETPNDNTTYVVISFIDFSNGFGILSNAAQTNWMGPNGRGLERQGPHQCVPSRRRVGALPVHHHRAGILYLSMAF